MKDEIKEGNRERQEKAVVLVSFTVAMIKVHPTAASAQEKRFISAPSSRI